MSVFSGLLGLIGTAITNEQNYINTQETNAANLQQVRETNAANLAATKDTNATNLSIAKETNASNELIMQRTNEFNAAQADLAYQRSTSSAKVAELIAAGISPQQARQIVAGGGLTSTATAASGTAIPAQGATMQAPTAQAAQFQTPQVADWGKGMAELGAGVDSFFNQYISSFSDPTGGIVGALGSNEMFELASQNIASLPSNAVASAYNFEKFLQEQKEGFWYDFRNSEGFTNMWKKPLARRSFLYLMNQVYADSATIENSLERQEAENRLLHLQETADALKNQLTTQQIDNSIKQGTILSQNIVAGEIANQRNSILLNRDKALAEYITQAEIGRLQNLLTDQELQKRLLNDPAYCEAWFNSQLSNKLMAAAMNSYAAMQAQGKVDFLKDHPEDQLQLLLFSMLDDLGFGNSQLCWDLKDNFMAGSNLIDFLTKRSGNSFLGIDGKVLKNGADLYTPLRYLWTWRNQALPLTKKEKWEIGTTIIGTVGSMIPKK